jgi:hypothetical protein
LIRYKHLAHPVDMATLARKIRAEHMMRQLLEDNGLPEPDAVEYGYGCIRLFFEEPKLCVVIDIDDPEPGHDEASAEIEEASADAELN